MGEIKLFNRWDLNDVKIEDAGLKNYMNIKPIIVPRTGGRFIPKLHKEHINIVERFINKLMVPGHRGKKHKLSSGRCTGSTQAIYLSVKKAFELIEKRTKNNPVQTLVKAIENSAILEEVASYRLGGIIARKSVIVSPQRRLDIALRHLSQGIYKNNFRNKKPLAETIAEQLLAAANNDVKNFAIQERNRIEKEAEGAR